MAARYTVGIDLGTSHTVVAFTDTAGKAAISVFNVARRVSLNQTARQATLPSVLYAPLPEETGELGSAWLVGNFAHQRGREVTGRAILSAKSWLCHAAVDRQAAVLPWGAPTDAPRLSPVEASARIFQHVRDDWEQQFPQAPLGDQQMIVTVPASFDPIARQLTVKAAADAGLSVRLLEEPQAAFYDYLDLYGLQALKQKLAQLPDGSARILVCDVGGGTTDLTLLSVTQSDEGPLLIERTAVGRHLLLGGDNMDLALAHQVESSLGDQQRFDAQELIKWVLTCRDAKERLLLPDAADEIRVATVTTGSALVGRTRSATLLREQVRQTLLDGFFPLVEPGTVPRVHRGALLGFGLPYESDPSISSHVSAFLLRHLPRDARVDLVLLNGGVFSSPLLAARLVAVLQNLGHPTELLPCTHPDLAVGRGAVKYGLSLNGHGLRIGGGASHGYYVGFDAPAERERKVMCVVPRGAKEAERHRAESQQFALRVGVPVRFELYSSDMSIADAAGQIVALDDQLELLPPLVTQLVVPDVTAREVVVQLEGELTAVGTLDIHCVPKAAELADTAFALAFELRGQERPVSTAATNRASGAPRGDRLVDAYEAIQRVFGKGRAGVESRETKDLVRNLERLLGARKDWTLNVNRSLFDVIAPKHAARRRSADHERVYWMLTGYTLRPGFGHLLDRQRVELLLPLFKQGFSSADNVRGWQQFLIAWRRVLPGMNEREQLATLDVLAPLVGRAATRVKPPKGFQGVTQPELLELVGLMERLPTTQRAALGNTILERTWTETDPKLWQTIGRLGSRVPLYASAHYVVEPRDAEAWLAQLLREKWEGIPTALVAAAQLARLTGDRARDIAESLRRDVVLRMQQHQARPEMLRLVTEVVPVTESDSVMQFGDELPVGLVWHSGDE